MGMSGERQSKPGHWCIECGYALSGLSPSEGVYQCPECGTGMTVAQAARMVRQAWAVPSSQLNTNSLLFCLVMTFVGLLMSGLSGPIFRYAWVLGAAGVVGAVAIPFWMAPRLLVRVYPRREVRAPALALALVAVAINLVVLGLVIGFLMLAVNGIVSFMPRAHSG